MYGTFIGDIVGSKYEFDNIKTKDFDLFSSDCNYTDDTIMTVAIAKAIMESIEKDDDLKETIIKTMQDFGRRFPCPKGAYGSRFSSWLKETDPKPYNSFGNGSAMRVSPCGLIALSLEEAKRLAALSASVSHNHPEGIKGAQAVSSAIFLAKIGKSKDDIKKYIEDNFYSLDFSLESIRPGYSFDVSCQGSVPQALVAFLESTDFEDSIRNAISIGGDSDTIGAITGSIALPYYQAQLKAHPDADACAQIEKIIAQAKIYLPDEFIEIAEDFDTLCRKRADDFKDRGGKGYRRV
ncbi:MAG: ADP-ribosylglycohydrolase family protein [Finegoldia sp.]|nr:ADP-ribosylglycohydrolase family protein [Finegoldia sp.]